MFRIIMDLLFKKYMDKLEEIHKTVIEVNKNEI